MLPIWSVSISRWVQKVPALCSLSLWEVLIWRRGNMEELLCVWNCLINIVFHFSFCLVYKGFCLWSQTCEQRMHETKEAWWVCFTFLMRNWSHTHWKLLKLDSWIIWRGELVEFQFKELLTRNSFLHQFLHFYLSRILGSLLCSFQCPWCTWHIKVGWILQSLGIRISLECSKLYWERFCMCVSFFFFTLEFPSTQNSACHKLSD